MNVKVTADDIAQLLASSPPRQVPAHVRKAVRGGTVWGAVLFGLFFGSFGMIFVFFFFPWRMGEELRLALGSTRTTTGIVSDTHETNMSVNEQQVYGFTVDYAGDASGRHSVTCYASGERWSKGERVTVRYLASNPAIACIQGARLDEGGLFGMVVLIFPVIGYGIAGGILLLRVNATRILREGVAAEVDVLAVTPTGMKVNNQTVYKITLSSPTFAAGQPMIVRRYHPADVALATQHAEQKQPVFILHNPRKPKQLVFPEALIEA